MEEPRPSYSKELRDKFTYVMNVLRAGTSGKSLSKVLGAVGLGIFIGCLPIYGIQFLFILMLCLLFKLDFAIAYVASHISNPLTLPLILFLEAEVGSFALTQKHLVLDIKNINYSSLINFGYEIVLGSIIIAPIFATIGMGFTYLIIKLNQRKRNDN